MLSCLQGKLLMARSQKNWQGHRVIIEPQTFCYLKEIELKITKIQRKTKQ